MEVVGVADGSILALGDRAAARYAAGTYGNTMAATPRALDVVRACLGEQLWAAFVSYANAH